MIARSFPVANPSGYTHHKAFLPTQIRELLDISPNRPLRAGMGRPVKPG
jgi:hypothetical protein